MNLASSGSPTSKFEPEMLGPKKEAERIAAFGVEHDIKFNLCLPAIESDGVQDVAVDRERERGAT
jgi:hypothetical protein